MTLPKTHAGTGFMHEGFHKDDPRSSPGLFAWANTIFGELILKVFQEPHACSIKGTFPARAKTGTQQSSGRTAAFSRAFRPSSAHPLKASRSVRPGPGPGLRGARELTWRS